MTKSELIGLFYSRFRHLSATDAERVINVILDEISSAMERGDRVELRCFGSFSVKARNELVGRNPRTGARVVIAGRKVVSFKKSKEMHKRLNGAAM